MSSKYITEQPHFVVNIDSQSMKERRDKDVKSFDNICNSFLTRINNNAPNN